MAFGVCLFPGESAFAPGWFPDSVGSQKAVEGSKHYPQVPRPNVRIPQGFRLKAQGWREAGAPTLG